MKISEIEFTGAKYYDIECGVYLDELPYSHYEKQGDIYLVKGDIKSTEIVKITKKSYMDDENEKR
jgi:hypothetical protein